MKHADKSIKYGMKVLGICALLFLAWSAFLPIESASIADGVVVLDFNNKTIQHLEGGIIEKILVKEGQLVEKDEPMLYLHDIRAKSEQQIVQEKLWTMELQRERLMAEKNNSAINLEKFLAKITKVSEENDAKIKEIIANQNKLFHARQDKKNGDVKVMEKKIKSAQTRLKISRKELESIKTLVDEGNISELRALDLQRSITELEYEEQSTKLQIVNYQNEILGEIMKELKETDVEIVALSNQLKSSQDVLARSAILAPVAGKVMNMKYHTIGAVVPPAGEIMNIVPQNDELIIEAKIKPQDIDNVAAGMKAKIMLTAYKGKKVPKLNGVVTNVSPDIITNEQAHETYFLARVKIDKKEIKRLKNKITLYPGMPAQVFIITGSRSLISYLFTPISDSAYRAFREE